MFILGSTIKYNRSQITYDVIADLTNCTSDNDSAIIHLDDTYVANITADAGYTLEGASVLITMGGVDVTASVYNDGIITIASATGDIVINIAAVESGPQPLPASYFEFSSGSGSGSGSGSDGLAIYSFSAAGETAYDNGEITALILPDNDGQGNTVTGIGTSAFYNRSSITSVTIPNTITSIGSTAFAGCSSLTSITIPSSVTNIIVSAFSDCSSIASITVDSNNTTFDSRNNCNCIIKTATNELVVGCKNSIIPNSVTSIARYAFAGCTGLTSIEIPSLVTSIGDAAFSSCAGLTSIEIPSLVTSIGRMAFASCTGLTSITVEATTPPTSGAQAFDGTNDCPIYVPAASLTAYQNATNWAEYASRIQAIPEV